MPAGIGALRRPVPAGQRVRAALGVFGRAVVERGRKALERYQKRGFGSRGRGISEERQKMLQEEMVPKLLDEILKASPASPDVKVDEIAKAINRLNNPLEKKFVLDAMGQMLEKAHAEGQMGVREFQERANILRALGKRIGFSYRRV